MTRGAVDLQVRRGPQEEAPALVREGQAARHQGGVRSRPPRTCTWAHRCCSTRMRRFQDFGHTVVFLIGDFTGADRRPTGKNTTRPPLTARGGEGQRGDVQAAGLQGPGPEQDARCASTREWLDALGTEGMIELAARYTVARMLERDDFKKRLQGEPPIALHEFLYPLLQGYDSVALKADVELGATDQLFNLLVGRQLMKEYGQEPQVIMTGPILEGLDAKRSTADRRRQDVQEPGQLRGHRRAGGPASSAS